MKYKKRLLRLKARQQAWEKLSAQDKKACKKPGSRNK